MRLLKKMVYLLSGLKGTKVDELIISYEGDQVDKEIQVDQYFI